MEAVARWVVANRLLVVCLSLCLTLLFAANLRNLDVIVDPNELLPRDHPQVVTTERVEAIFGNRFTLVVTITPKVGDIYTPEILGKILTLTEALQATDGVVASEVRSLGSRRAKDIVGTADGLEVQRILDTVPADRTEARAVAERFARNPMYDKLLVSEDGRTAAVLAEVKRDAAGFGPTMDRIDRAVDQIRGDNVTIALGGMPVFLEALERYSKRMAYLLPIAILLIGLAHYEAFRTVQAMVLPLMTAVLAVVWSLGIMTIAGVHLDPFNNITPILILAVAAGHAVQMLKRYYEEYRALMAEGPDGLPDGLDAGAANREAVVRALIRVGPVMLGAGTVAALSFLSLAAFPIQSIRSFGLFAGLGILAILAIEIFVTPAVRAMLKPPTAREAGAERAESFWSRIARRLGAAVAHRAGRQRIFLAWGVVAAVSLAGAAMVRVDNSNRSFFGTAQPERVDDSKINAALAGTNTLSVLVEGPPDTLKDPAVLRTMDRIQSELEADPDVGRTLSIVDFVKHIHGAMIGDTVTQPSLPESSELISQYLLLYSLSGEPGDFDGLVDYTYQSAIVQVFVKTDSSATVQRLNAKIRPLMDTGFPPGVTASIGGSVVTPAAMSEILIEGKLWNIVQIAAVVFVVSALMSRSVLMGALILVPLIMTVLAVFGVMGITGIPLQMATATVSALGIGIGADYAIYFSFRLREELRRGASEQQALAATFASAGKAVMFVATAVAAGYSALMLSIGFNIHFWLGFLVSLAMVVAAASTLTLFAALLMTLRPQRLFGRTREEGIGEGIKPAAATAAVALIAMLLMSPEPAAAQAATGAGTPSDDAAAASYMALSSQATKVLRSDARARFVLTNRGGQQRIRETESRSELKPGGVLNQRLVRFTSPADIRGTAVLTIENEGKDDDIWLYLPALRKVRRLVASNRKDSFVGTDFSYGDIIGHPVEEWQHRILRTEALAGVPTRVIESRPATAAVGANSGYSRRVNWLREADHVPVKVEYFDPQGRLLKTYEASDIRLVDPKNGRYQPMRQRMINAQTGHSSTIEYLSFDTSTALPADTFLPRTLERP